MISIYVYGCRCIYWVYGEEIPTQTEVKQLKSIYIYIYI